MDIIQARKVHGLYPILITAGIAVTIFSALGIAAITGHIPLARSDPAPEAEQAKPAAAICSRCGVVSSIRAIESEGQATGLGAVAGGVTGALLGNQIGSGNGRTAMTVVGAAGGAYVGNRIERQVRARVTYKVVVRMDDGTRRTVYLGHAPAAAVGERVRVANGTVTALN